MSYTIIEVCNGCGACKKICPANAISGTLKKLHEIDATLCIECGACGKVCPKGAVKDNFGRVYAMVKKSEWEKPVFDNIKCMSCSICVDTCPTNCLAMSGAMGLDKHPKPYVKDDKACIGCGFCAAECPVDAIIMVKPAPKAD
jgi:ferredoxin